MKRLLVLIILVYAVIVATMLLLSGVLMNKDLNIQPLLAGNNDPVLIGEKIYYIPVVSAEYENDDISKNELENIRIISDDNNLGILPNQLADVMYVRADEIQSFLNNGYIAVIQPSQLQEGFKVLSVDGQSYYDKTKDRGQYNLYFIDTIQ